MAEIVDFPSHPTLENLEQAEAIIEQMAEEIEDLRAFAQFIIDGYPDLNLNHEDFRVGAYCNALKALGQEASERERIIGRLKESGVFSGNVQGANTEAKNEGQSA